MDIAVVDKQGFEDMKHVGEQGEEFWFARELCEVLEYSQWRNFEKVINTAKIACKISQQEPADHFAEVSKMVEAGVSVKKVKDYKLRSLFIENGQ